MGNGKRGALVIARVSASIAGEGLSRARRQRFDLLVDGAFIRTSVFRLGLAVVQRVYTVKCPLQG